MTRPPAPVDLRPAELMPLDIAARLGAVQSRVACAAAWRLAGVVSNGRAARAAARGDRSIAADHARAALNQLSAAHWLERTTRGPQCP